MTKTPVLFTPTQRFVAESRKAAAPAPGISGGNCKFNFIDGQIQAACLMIPAAQYPVSDIRNLRNALFSPQWTDLNTQPTTASFLANWNSRRDPIPTSTARLDHDPSKTHNVVDPYLWHRHLVGPGICAYPETDNNG